MRDRRRAQDTNSLRRGDWVPRAEWTHRLGGIQRRSMPGRDGAATAGLCNRAMADALRRSIQRREWRGRGGDEGRTCRMPLAERIPASHPRRRTTEPCALSPRTPGLEFPRRQALTLGARAKRAAEPAIRDGRRISGATRSKGRSDPPRRSRCQAPTTSRRFAGRTCVPFELGKDRALEVKWFAECSG